MKKLSFFLTVLVLLCSLGGCYSQSEYDQAVADAKELGYQEGKAYGRQECYAELSQAELGEKDAAPAPEDPSDTASENTDGSYIANTSSGKFHRSTCGYLPDEGNRAYYSSREEAVSAGYTPCQRCNP